MAAVNNMATVTIDQAYFETLLRKAHFDTTGGHDFSTPVNVPTVTIPKLDHDNLLSSARQYANLKRNLYRGGIAKETLAILVRNDAPATENDSGTVTVDESLDTGSFFAPQPTSMSVQDYTFRRNANYTSRSDARPQESNGNGNGNGYGYDNGTGTGNSNGFHNYAQPTEDLLFMAESNDVFYDEGSGNNDSQPRRQRQQYDKFAKRTVLLVNLPENTTHEDITDAVRGGLLLDIYLRIHDRTASISFLEEAAAQEFFSHVKRYDLYIKGKRVDIRWNERQFILPGHVANKVSIGATRNLVIYNCSPKHTEEKIRDNLEHIHNLVVIKVVFSGPHCFISTNSVHNSMFARTCMMSRSLYKGSKIEWADDECALPLQRPLQSRKENLPPKKSSAPLTNRFQLLNMDGDDGDDDDSNDDENDSSGVTLPHLGFKISPTTVVA